MPEFETYAHQLISAERRIKVLEDRRMDTRGAKSLNHEIAGQEDLRFEALYHLAVLRTTDPTLPVSLAITTGEYKGRREKLHSYSLNQTTLTLPNLEPENNEGPLYVTGFTLDWMISDGPVRSVPMLPDSLAVAHLFPFHTATPEPSLASYFTRSMDEFFAIKRALSDHHKNNHTGPDVRNLRLEEDNIILRLLHLRQSEGLRKRIILYPYITEHQQTEPNTARIEIPDMDFFYWLRLSLKPRETQREMRELIKQSGGYNGPIRRS